MNDKILLKHPVTGGEFESTIKAYEEVWKDKDWRPASELPVEVPADQIDIRQDPTDLSEQDPEAGSSPTTEEGTPEDTSPAPSTTGEGTSRRRRQSQED